MDFLSDTVPASTCRVISAPQLDGARNVQFRHFSIDRERRNTVLEGQHGVFEKRNVLQLIHVVQSDDIEYAR